MRKSYIGDDGFDWNALIKEVTQTAQTVLPTILNHGNTTNPYGGQSLYPSTSSNINPQTGLPYTYSPGQTYPQQQSSPLNMTNILLLGAGGLLLYKLMKKK